MNQGQNQLYLFKTRKFLPLFIIQFCGCLNDNILKNALIILITYKLASSLSYSPAILALLANTIFTLPFILFASIAGQVADRYERSLIVKIIKFVEIIIVIISFYGFINNNLIIIFSCIAMLGVHSTFFGPIKYSALPDHLTKNELLSANGFVEAGTFFSILIGTIIGGYYTIIPNIIIATAIITALIGFTSSFFLPKSGNKNQKIIINFNIIRETINIINNAKAKKQVYLSILGISWFWFIGAAILAQIPSLTKDILGGDENVANLFLATFSVGVGVGSFVCNLILKNEITTKYIVISALGLSICGIDLALASRISGMYYEHGELSSIIVFLSKLHNWRIIIDLFFFSAIGGIYVVPLFAVMQYFSSPTHRSRIIAANNFINSVFMAASTIILSLLFYLGFSIPSVITIVSVANIFVAISIYKLVSTEIMPIKFLRQILRLIFDIFYNVEVKGIENFHKAGKRAVIIANHLSYIDPALIAVYLPERITFAINTAVANLWWVKPFLKIVKTLPVDPNNPMAIKTLINLVKANKKIAIFPEGRISLTGSLMKIYEGPGLIAHKSDANILPIRIDGTQYTHFSKLQNIFKSRLFPKIIITILPPTKLSPIEDDNKSWRKTVSTRLYDIMTDMLFESSDYQKPLFQSLIESAKIYGFNKIIMHDIDNNALSYRQLLIKSFIINDLVSAATEKGEHVGLMLPNMSGTASAFYGISACGRIPAMINFTAGASNIVASCKTANINIIYSSSKFIKKAELHEVTDIILQNNIKIIFLEDIVRTLTFKIKFQAVIASIFPNLYYNFVLGRAKSHDKAVILFTSGTENIPKCVVLSHQNIQANRYQIISKVDFAPHDIAFNAMPMFHCFGLTGTILMSLSGIKTFFYPSPLHYKIIPELIYDIGATIMFSTDSFLNGYFGHAHPYDFYSLRYIFAGAEKLKEQTRVSWLNKYGVRIFEGYGATECSPVIAANTAMHNSPGTVGRLMPKIEYHIEPIEGIAEGGLLYIKGPNIMLGYIEHINPGIVMDTACPNLGLGWYNTGDIVRIDDKSFITIIGRQKRFAKIAGEMISLTLIESLATELSSTDINGAIEIADDKKGEQIILFTTNLALTKDKFLKILKASNLPELYLPKNIIHLQEIPLLATGKINYMELKIKFKTNY